jgi:hypothetical protein
MAPGNSECGTRKLKAALDSLGRKESQAEDLIRTLETSQTSLREEVERLNACQKSPGPPPASSGTPKLRVEIPTLQLKSKDGSISYPTKSGIAPQKEIVADLTGFLRFIADFAAKSLFR